jgi:hypothetical protein
MYPYTHTGPVAFAGGVIPPINSMILPVSVQPPVEQFRMRVIHLPTRGPHSLGRRPTSPIHQGFLTVDGEITGGDGLTITANGATITGDSQIDGSMAVTGALSISVVGCIWMAHPACISFHQIHPSFLFLLLLLPDSRCTLGGLYHCNCWAVLLRGRDR